jgi:uncharacterized glyoxalase superfamily protein PhnB
MPEVSLSEPPWIFPTIRCRAAEAMIQWLTGVLGFREHFAHRRQGIVEHAHLAFGSSILMLGQSRDDDYDKMVGKAGARRTDSLYVAVDNPDELFARAKNAGATIEMELRDAEYGNCEFACRDPEGNLWSFGNYWPKADDKPADA